MRTPSIQCHPYRFEQGGIPMVEIWTVMRQPDLPPNNTWIDIHIVRRTAAEQARLEALGQAAYEAGFVGNAVLPGAPAEEERVDLGAASQQSAIEILADRHPQDPDARDQAEALVYSL